MSYRETILSRFAGTGSGTPLYLPDLTLWYGWHRGRGTLPEHWQGWSLPGIARDLGLPIWLTVQPWRLETAGVAVSLEEGEEERIVRAEAVEGTLQARWTRGPNADWWQVEYPVKEADHLPAALALAEARSYVVDGAGLERARELVGEDGVLALELPRRGLSDLLHKFLGWGEGLRFLHDVRAGQIVLSPDNLDGQFVSPRLFERHLADSYRLSSRMLHRHDKWLLVHAGGPVGQLLAPLAQVGVDGVQGIAGPPQGDTTLAEARQIAGPAITLWGGIPQDYLLGIHGQEVLEVAVQQATQQAAADGRMILGVADRVPPAADLARLEAIPGLVAGS